MRGNVWASRADAVQQVLDERFWNEAIRMYNIAAPCPNGECNTIFHYWWMAHAVDNLVDAYTRTKDERYAKRLEQLYDGLLSRNLGAWPNALYDDMEWMAIAWLRAYEATGVHRYKEAALVLWEDIKGGWNDHCGGGIAWQKTQLDYKNTPANAPAVILASRLYEAFGREEDLVWAKRIYDWQRRNLVDPETGFVWDGMNRLGDGQIDKDWKFTYCQGVFIGAGTELYRSTRERMYIEDAVRSANASRSVLACEDTGLLPAEGSGDGGLFKGILARYLTLLAVRENHSTLTVWLLGNAESLWNAGRAQPGLFGEAWNEQPGELVELSTQLSGAMLIESAALLEKQGVVVT